MKTHSIISTSLTNSQRHLFNPIKSLKPESLTRLLDAFHQGNLAGAALVWDSIEHRDDVLQGVASKRKKSIARLPWQILTVDDSAEALEHKRALEYLYNHITTTHATDANISGGFSLLVKYMMDAIGKKYSVHEIIYQPQSNGLLTVNFRFVPLWFFENRSGALRFCHSSDTTQSVPLESGAWLVTTGDGLMEASSIAYIFKHLPLRDWLIYCGRNGMPGVKGVTDAAPGSPQWESARQAVQSFGAEFIALVSSGTDIQAIDISSRTELPYPHLIDRMDRAIIALWRGSDLSTLSKSNATGVSLQSDEAFILQQDDAALISETLNAQVDKFVIKYLFKTDHPKAYIRLQSHNPVAFDTELHRYQALLQMGIPIPLTHLQEHFGLPKPHPNEPVLPKDATASYKRSMSD